MPRTLNEIMKDEMKLAHYCVLDQDFDSMEELQLDYAPEAEEYAA